jgi:hypothetical protein
MIQFFLVGLLMVGALLMARLLWYRCRVWEDDGGWMGGDIVGGSGCLVEGETGALDIMLCWVEQIGCPFFPNMTQEEEKVWAQHLP